MTAALQLTTGSNKSSDECSGYSHQKVMVAIENLVLVVIAVAVAVAVVVCSDNISRSGDDHGSHRAAEVAIDTSGF